MEGEFFGSLADAVVGSDAGFSASFEPLDAGASGFVGPDGASLAAPFALPAVKFLVDQGYRLQAVLNDNLVFLDG